MSSEYQDELRRIVNALTIQSPHAFALGEREVRVAPAPRRERRDEASSFIHALQTHLYLHCYCRSFEEVIPQPPAATERAPELVASLIEMNAGQEHLQAGWRIAQILPSGQVVVQRQGVSRMLWPGEFLSSAGGPLRVDDHVVVCCRKDSLTLQSSFYFMFGETLADQQDDARLVRFYWNIEEAGIRELVQGVTRKLNRFRLSFRFKCVNRADQYSRSDAAVLFVTRRNYAIVAELLVDVYPRVASHLRASTPLFSKRLAPGLGFAEDPGNDESFGSHRCRLVAEALWHAHRRGHDDLESRLAFVRENFHRHGLNLDAPYLNHESRDSYRWPSDMVSFDDSIS